MKNSTNLRLSKKYYDVVTYTYTYMYFFFTAVDAISIFNYYACNTYLYYAYNNNTDNIITRDCTHKSSTKNVNNEYTQTIKNALQLFF